MRATNSTEVLDGSSSNEMTKRDTKRQLLFIIGIFLCVIGVGSLIATTVILLKREISTACPKENLKADKHGRESLCGCCNNEKDNSKLQDLFKTIKNTYNDFRLGQQNDEKINGGSLALNFTPEAYKYKTQTAQLLLKKLRKFEENFLTRTASDEERHTFELFKYFLSNTFGAPYENNYEAGDWLMGPNIFCWQQSCSLISEIAGMLGDFLPRSGQDVAMVIGLMKKYGETCRQRMRNLRYGVKVGIVPPEEACRAGVNTFKLYNINVAKNGIKGILDESVVKRILNSSFLDKLTKEDKKRWKEKYKESINESLFYSILKNIGKPLHDFIRYLEEDYITHCPPSNVSSGFASLPLPYVYTKGVPDKNTLTNGSLPGGEKFNGSHAYKILLSYFTTYDVTPKEIDELANKKLNELYPQVVKIAKELTKENTTDTAIKRFQAMLSDQKYYYTFNNDSHNITQHSLMCNDAESAKKYCPERWKAMNNWLKSARVILSLLRTKLSSAFYLSGDKCNLPKCPVDIDFNFNPSSAYYSYAEGNKDCSSLAMVSIPFFLDKLGPKYEEMTVVVHESYPGHHLEVQGVREHFEFKCEKMGQWVSNMNYFAAFSEGWATYVEKRVAKVDMKLYKDDLINEYGMLKHQILAALRAKVDVGLHYMGMKRDKAMQLYQEYAWTSGDVINKEITRLQSTPGQGTSYMVGENRLSELREKTMKELGDKFDVRDFHFNVLDKGPLPMTYLETKIEEYIRDSS